MDHKIQKMQKLIRKMRALEDKTKILFDEARLLIGGDRRTEFLEKLSEIDGLRKDRRLLSQEYFGVSRAHRAE